MGELERDGNMETQTNTSYCIGLNSHRSEYPREGSSGYLDISLLAHAIPISLVNTWRGLLIFG